MELRNVFITKSVLEVYDDKFRKPLDCLTGFDDFTKRYVGGLHNLSMSDKQTWTKNNNGPLRIIEIESGREEVWFPKRNNKPSYVSLNSDMELESHQKFNRYLPAIHFPNENLRFEKDGIRQSSLYRYAPRNLNLWYKNDLVTNVEDNPAISCKNMLYTVQDPKVEYIRYIGFDRLIEDWENGEWKGTRVSGLRVLFSNERLNGEETDKAITNWLEEHCKNGFFPFEFKLFGDEEEEFLFVSDFCT